MFPDFENGSKYEWIAITTAGCRTITDLAIGVAICIALKAKAGLLWSNSFVKLIGDLAIVSGVLTSLASTAYLISLITRPSNLTYTGLYYVYGKLHVNTLLAG
ncbi:hypothetical protein GLOTRDRAFT_140227 [Gloeophyllum trabeum ATCC 11539]|uniref:DUF6534 domain-containing protein n=1 Tax=Gloeophyllum trabeum (strain ATCC 11539 / FP-39264 / Madison 617) TaxID=670483 RepID=S7RE86_GLOTA|nr:uncharacterized protein GLOTRDRAFT_140227 [Gloeophyllum trabeum ATCC 11539]EPQ52500.1 hypothetical protein GLOTRDRAFT_140227 [Gloeophyllum trabeum ATCC 11539]